MCIRCHHLLHTYPTTFVKFILNRKKIEETNILPKVPESCYQCKFARIPNDGEDLKIKCMKHKARVMSFGENWLCRSYRKKIINNTKIKNMKKIEKINRIKYYNSGKSWTEEEDEILTQDWLGGLPNRKIGYKLGRLLASVNSRVLKLKIYELKDK